MNLYAITNRRGNPFVIANGSSIGETAELIRDYVTRKAHGRSTSRARQGAGSGALLCHVKDGERIGARFIQSRPRT